MSVDVPDLPALLARYERPLVRYAQSILGDLEMARDVVQETFIRYCRRSPEPEEAARPDALPPPESSAPSVTADGVPRPLEAWLFTVTRNLSIDQQRKQSRIIYLPKTEDRTADEPGPGAALEAKESEDVLFSLLHQLSANQSEVIRLKFQNDLSYKEIADITQLSVTNIGFLLHTGLKKLRAILAAQPPERTSSPIRHVL